MTNRLGKKPARPGAYKLKLATYFNAGGGLPIAPAVFGHTNLVGSLGMLGNDQYGDCVWAGAAHETMIWSAEASIPVKFTDSGVLSDYSAVTGFNPTDPNSDQGTDMEEAAKYRRKTGIVDGKSKRHVVNAYLELPGISAQGANDPNRLIPALASAGYVFGAVGIGIEFPSSAMDQFDAGQPWSVVKDSPIEGGHYVPLVGRKANGNFVVVTWGKLQEVTPQFFAQYVDEAVAYISLERLNNGKTLDGFDIAALQADLAALGGSSPDPEPTPEPEPDENVDFLNEWAELKHTGKNGEAAKAWLAVKTAHNL